MNLDALGNGVLKDQQLQGFIEAETQKQRFNVSMSVICGFEMPSLV